MNRNYMNRGTRGGYGRGYERGHNDSISAAANPDEWVKQGEVLAMAYVPRQLFTNLYQPAEALRAGTLFADLDLPYCTGGTR